MFNKRIAEFSILGLFDVDEHHEDVSGKHVFLSFDLNLLSKIFSQTVHKAFNCFTIVLFVASVTVDDDD